MPVNKVVYGTTTIIDISDVDVTPDSLAEGKTAYDKTGTKITGTMKSGSGGETEPVFVPEKYVNFWDYDGTLLYSYTKEEALALTELPPLPTRSGLTCQGWNFTLDEIKTDGRSIDVGATYITDDGKTRVYVNLRDGRTSPILGCCPKGTVTVDWGDGTTPTVLTGTSTSKVVWTQPHTYVSPGEYVIALTVDGEMGFYGDSSSNLYSGILRYSEEADTRNIAYHGCVRKIEIGSGVNSLNNYIFRGLYNLESITIPNGIGSTSNYLCYQCYNLGCVILPRSITKVVQFSFYGCQTLSVVSLPYGVAEIGQGSFRGCYKLTKFIVPTGVTWINNNTFADAYGVRYYDFTTFKNVPFTGGSSMFSKISSDCEIRVPADLLEEWIAATNWVEYAENIVGV